MSGCFYCRHHQENPSWSFGSQVPRYVCATGENPAQVGNEPEDVRTCAKGEPQVGFQIGGYYRHMWFEGEPPVKLRGGARVGGCLEWWIDGDAEYPGKGHMQFHLCDWHRIESWVEFWGKELRRRGWVVDEEDDDA